MKKLNRKLPTLLILAMLALAGCKTAPVQDTTGDREVAQAALGLMEYVSSQRGIAVKEVENAAMKDLALSFAKKSNGYLELFGSKQITAADLYRVDQVKLARLLGKEFTKTIKVSETEMVSIQQKMMQSQASSVRPSSQLKESSAQLSNLFQGNVSKVTITDQGLNSAVKDAEKILDRNHAREIRVLAENLTLTSKTLEASEAKELIETGTDVIRSELRIFEKTNGNIKVIAEGCGNSSDIVALKNFSSIMKETEANITRATTAKEAGQAVDRAIANTLQVSEVEAKARRDALTKGNGNCPYVHPL